MRKSISIVQFKTHEKLLYLQKRKTPLSLQLQQQKLKQLNFIKNINIYIFVYFIIEIIFNEKKNLLQEEHYSYFFFHFCVILFLF